MGLNVITALPCSILHLSLDIAEFISQKRFGKKDFGRKPIKPQFQCITYKAPWLGFGILGKESWSKLLKLLFEKERILLNA